MEQAFLTALLCFLFGTVAVARDVNLQCGEQEDGEKFNLKLNLESGIGSVDNEQLSFAGQTKEHVFFFLIVGGSTEAELVSFALNKKTGRFWISQIPPTEKHNISKGHCFAPLE